jgi:hypothetical protein
MTYLDDLFAWAAQESEGGNIPTLKAGLQSWWAYPDGTNFPTTNVYATATAGSVTYFPPTPIRDPAPLGPPIIVSYTPPYFLGAITLQFSPWAIEKLDIPPETPPSPVGVLVQAPAQNPMAINLGEIGPAVYTVTLGQLNVPGWRQYIYGSALSDAVTFQQETTYQTPAGYFSAFPFDGYQIPAEDFVKVQLGFQPS